MKLSDLSLRAIYAWGCERDGACWIWRRYYNTKGAPEMIISDLSRQTVKVRRVVAALKAGRSVANVLADRRHRAWMTCANPDCCVAAAHMMDGDVTAQYAWRRSQGKLRPNAATRLLLSMHSRRRAKLSEDIVREIRASSEPNTALARRYGVHHSLVARIRNGEIWNGLALNNSVFNMQA